MKRTYVVIMTAGCYDEQKTVVIYAGEDLMRAIEVSKTTPYFNEGNEYVYIDVWEAGKVVETVAVRDFDEVLI